MQNFLLTSKSNMQLNDSTKKEKESPTQQPEKLQLKAGRKGREKMAKSVTQQIA